MKSQCVFNPNGTLVAMPVNSVVYVVDVKTRKSIVQLEGHGAIVTSLAFNPHRPQQLATTSEDQNETKKTTRTSSIDGRDGEVRAVNGTDGRLFCIVASLTTSALRAD